MLLTCTSLCTRIPSGLMVLPSKSADFTSGKKRCHCFLLSNRTKNCKGSFLKRERTQKRSSVTDMPEKMLSFICGLRKDVCLVSFSVLFQVKKIFRKNLGGERTNLKKCLLGMRHSFCHWTVIDVLLFLLPDSGGRRSTSCG